MEFEDALGRQAGERGVEGGDRGADIEELGRAPAQGVPVLGAMLVLGGGDADPDLAGYTPTIAAVLGMMP